MIVDCRVGITSHIAVTPMVSYNDVKVEVWFPINPVVCISYSNRSTKKFCELVVSLISYPYMGLT